MAHDDSPQSKWYAPARCASGGLSRTKTGGIDYALVRQARITGNESYYRDALLPRSGLLEQAAAS